MEKRTNRYRITLEQLATAQENQPLPNSLQLEFDNHDEIFAIIQKLREKDPFQDQNQAAEFALGLKMFSEVMLKNRDNPLFEEFKPEFAAFMKKLKS